jgi:hypothetical protein
MEISVFLGLAGKEVGRRYSWMWGSFEGEHCVLKLESGWLTAQPFQQGVLYFI